MEDEPRLKVPLIGGRPLELDSAFELDLGRWKTLRTSASELAQLDITTPHDVKFANLQNLTKAASALQPSVAEVDMPNLCDEITKIRNGLSGLFAEPSGPLPLASIAIELGVTASGKVGFIVADASVEVSGKITVVFGKP
jgi:hypothetical protein